MKGLKPIEGPVVVSYLNRAQNPRYLKGFHVYYTVDGLIRDMHRIFEIATLSVGAKHAILINGFIIEYGDITPEEIEAYLATDVHIREQLDYKL